MVERGRGELNLDGRPRFERLSRLLAGEGRAKRDVPGDGRAVAALAIGPVADKAATFEWYDGGHPEPAIRDLFVAVLPVPYRGHRFSFELVLWAVVRVHQRAGYPQETRRWPALSGHDLLQLPDRDGRNDRLSGLVGVPVVNLTYHELVGITQHRHFLTCRLQRRACLLSRR